MGWFNSKSDIRDKIINIEKDLRSLEYEYIDRAIYQYITDTLEIGYDIEF